MADASTLISVVMDRNLPIMSEWKETRICLWKAVNALDRGTAPLDYLAFQSAAHAAFRACPGLRGGE